MASGQLACLHFGYCACVICFLFHSSFWLLCMQYVTLKALDYVSLLILLLWFTFISKCWYLNINTYKDIYTHMLNESGGLTRFFADENVQESSHPATSVDGTCTIILVHGLHSFCDSGTRVTLPWLHCGRGLLRRSHLHHRAHGLRALWIEAFWHLVQLPHSQHTLGLLPVLWRACWVAVWQRGIQSTPPHNDHITPQHSFAEFCKLRRWPPAEVHGVSLFPFRLPGHGRDVCNWYPPQCGAHSPDPPLVPRPIWAEWLDREEETGAAQIAVERPSFFLNQVGIEFIGLFVHVCLTLHDMMMKIVSSSICVGWCTISINRLMSGRLLENSRWCLPIKDRDNVNSRIHIDLLWWFVGGTSYFRCVTHANLATSILAWILV